MGRDIEQNKNFGNMQAVVDGFVELLYDESIRKYNFERRTLMTDKEKKKIKEAVRYVEDYLYYFYKFYNNDFKRIFLLLIDKLNYVAVLPVNERGIYGKFEDNGIYFNPVLSGNVFLNSDERTRLYIFHELGHIVNNQWMMDVLKHLNSRRLDVNKQYVYDGFSLLDEAITQNLAEEMAYYYAGKKRPGKANVRNITKYGSLFGGKTYQTNYDFYGELQGPASIFAKTLRGIVSNVGNNDDKSLMELCKRALNDNFFSNIYNEYEKDGQLYNFYQLFQYFGIIKNASYATFGMSDKKYLVASERALNEITTLGNYLYESRTDTFRRR